LYGYHEPASPTAESDRPAVRDRCQSADGGRVGL